MEKLRGSAPCSHHCLGSPGGRTLGQSRASPSAEEPASTRTPATRRPRPHGTPRPATSPRHLPGARLPPPRCCWPLGCGERTGNRLRHTRRRPHPEPCTPDGAGTGARRAGRGRERGRGRARLGKGLGTRRGSRARGLGRGWRGRAWSGRLGALEGLAEPRARLAWVEGAWCQGRLWFSGEGLAGARVAWARVHRVGADTACS